VFLSSASRLLRLLDLGENASASSDEQLNESCSLPELANVGAVQPDRFFVPSAGVTGCYQDDVSGGAALLVDDREGRRTVLIEGSTLFRNAHLAEGGNAALGLALLGQNDHLVWYVPSYADTDIEGTST